MEVNGDTAATAGFQSINMCRFMRCNAFQQGDDILVAIRYFAIGERSCSGNCIYWVEGVSKPGVLKHDNLSLLWFVYIIIDDRQ